jgi:hypothetical protein
VLVVLPLDNRTAAAAPSDEIRAVLVERLRDCGFDVVADDVLEAFLTGHRVRYTGGVSTDLAAALRDELGATAAFVTTLDRYDVGDPPILALTARLVASGPGPEVPWIDGFSMVGDESPGFLGLSTIADVGGLVDRAADRLVRSLARELSAPSQRGPDVADRRFRPRRIWRAEPDPAAGRTRIAVLPLRNESERRHAGDLVALHLLRHLAARPGVELIDPGEVRRGLLQMRFVGEDGVSLPQVQVLRVVLKADLVLTGAVYEYRERRGIEPPVVSFTTSLFDASDGALLATTSSHNSGDDGVFFFDWGRAWTAHDLTSRMAERLARSLFDGPP